MCNSSSFFFSYSAKFLVPNPSKGLTSSQDLTIPPPFYAL